MLTQDQLKEFFHYNSETGIFTRIKKVSGSSVGKIANAKYKHASGKIYQRIRINYESYFSHRLAWLYVYGKFPENHIDHINGDGEDNRISNLRDVFAADNRKNSKRAISNTSGITGVYWIKKKKRWGASIGHNNKTVYLGSFKEFNQAQEARKDAEIKYGYHKNHGRNIIAP